MQRKALHSETALGFPGLYGETGAALPGHNDSPTNEKEVHIMTNDFGPQNALRASTSSVSQEAPAPEFSTVRSAVRAAMARYGNELSFGGDVERGLAGLHPQAGGPEKVFRSLEGIAKMVQVRRQGLLKLGMVGWLNENGFRCSGESDTVRRRFDKRRERTFHDGERRVFFSVHVKVSDGSTPDRCVRIYLDWKESRQVAAIGWVGRHPK